ncbi:hypothetical protein IE53DRAFT_371858 [Violaceomyces palustris]|uniref:Uncharacterized protein n=1 Tax=Violaceomyces palustris TaxID=1673888 RepID=A0ACD0NMB2_9BASI|nr:hypothetical protein IE53DRAFT_371858 [Violaceomyces palustris]
MPPKNKKKQNISSNREMLSDKDALNVADDENITTDFDSPLVPASPTSSILSERPMEEAQAESESNVSSHGAGGEVLSGISVKADLAENGSAGHWAENVITATPCKMQPTYSQVLSAGAQAGATKSASIQEIQAPSLKANIPSGRQEAGESPALTSVSSNYGENDPQEHVSNSPECSEVATGSGYEHEDDEERDCKTAYTKQQYTIFIAGMPHALFPDTETEQDLQASLSRWAPVNRVKLIADPQNGHVKCAFADLSTERDAARVVSLATGTVFKGAKIRIELARADRTVCFSSLGTVNIDPLIEYGPFEEAKKYHVTTSARDGNRFPLTILLVKEIAQSFGNLELINEQPHFNSTGKKVFEVVFDRREDARDVVDDTGTLTASMDSTEDKKSIDPRPSKMGFLSAESPGVADNWHSSTISFSRA